MDQNTGQTIRVNGTQEPLMSTTIDGLLRAKGITTQNKGIAVALNGKVIPRRSWENTRLTKDDHVEIIKAFVGG